MTQMWGGAQWVLATMFVVTTVVPILAKASGITEAIERLPSSWGGRFSATLLVRIGLILILWWGGFWS